MDTIVILSFIAVVIYGWRKFTEVLKAQGRGWFFRNVAAFPLTMMLGMGWLLLLMGAGLWAPEEGSSPNVDMGTLLAAAILMAPHIMWIISAQRALTESHVPVSKPTPAAEPSESGDWSTGDRQARDIRTFVYKDAEGDITERVVRVTGETSQYLEGICLDRGSLRTFRKDRIVQFLDGAEDHPKPKRSQARSEVVRTDRSSVEINKSWVGLEVCFTGFKSDEKSELEQLAIQNDLRVRKTVTKGLDFLCAGKKAGPSKLSKAKANGARILSEEDFRHFLETGEVKVA